MARSALTTCTVRITVRDINGNNVPKQFSNVTNLIFDYFDNTVNIVDQVLGSFYFTIATITNLTYAVSGTTTTIVMS